MPATLARTARRTRHHYADHHPWARLAATAINRLDLLATPG